MLAAGCGTPIEFPEPPPPPPPAPPVPPPPSPAQVLAAPVLVAMPSNFTVSVGNASADVLWSLVNGAQSYRLDWASDPELLAGSASGTVSHGGLKNAEFRYIYAVTTGTQQTLLSAVPVDPDVTSPSQISISAGPRENTLSWSAVTGATAYRLYWSYFANVTPATGTRIDIDGSQTTYTHSGLDPGADYYYAVTAVLSNGAQGAASAEMGGRPGQTAAITATASDGHIDVTLPDGVIASVEVVTSRTFEVPFLPFPPRDGVPVPIHIDGLTNGTRYAFRVRPVFTGGAGPASATIFATPQAPATGAPEEVTLTAGRGVNILRWKPITGATSYEVTWTNTTDPLSGDTVTVSNPQFRHSQLDLCPEVGPSCPTYSYLVRDSRSAEISSAIEAVSVDLRAVPPSVTNAASVLLAGIKPSGSRVEIKDAGGAVVASVPFDRDTGWTAKVDLPADGTFLFRLVATDDTGLASTETVYQVTRDTTVPDPPTGTAVCDSATASFRTFVLSGGKPSGTAVFRKLEPEAPDDQIVGTTFDVTWSGLIQVETSTPLIDSISVIAKNAAGTASREFQIPLPSCP